MKYRLFSNSILNRFGNYVYQFSSNDKETGMIIYSRSIRYYIFPLCEHTEDSPSLFYELDIKEMGVVRVFI